jgi:flagellar basal-body rod modification protein FlgD
VNFEKPQHFQRGTLIAYLCQHDALVPGVRDGAKKESSQDYRLKEKAKFMDSSSAINSASSIQMDYMKLLITQLQNQNPLEPLDNNEMASQLAQFSQLQQLESLNSNFADVLSTTQRNYANSLIGKEITFATEDETGTSNITSGTVEEVINNVDGRTALVVGNNTIALEDVISVKN